MKRFYFHIVLVSLILYAGCNSATLKEYRNDKNQLVVEEWFNDHQLKSRIIYLNEEKSDYSSVEYFENGHLKDSITISNNLVQGTHKVYDPANDLLHIETYKDGVLNGPHMAVYSSGIASFKGYQMNGNKVGEWKFFYPEGNPITYEFYDSTGRLAYFLKYEKDGQHLHSEGSGIIHVSDIMNIDGQYSVDVLLAIPPNCSSGLSIVLLSEGQEQLVFNDEITTIRNNIPLPISGKGDYKIQMELNITDKQTGKVETYTVSKNISISNI